MNTWRVYYRHELPNPEYSFYEWVITDDRRVFSSDSEKDALLLCKKLNAAERDKTEIATLREALNNVRWDKFSCVGGTPACIECGMIKVLVEVHDPNCKIGRLFAGREKCIDIQ